MGVSKHLSPNRKGIPPIVGGYGQVPNCMDSPDPPGVTRCLNMRWSTDRHKGIDVAVPKATGHWQLRYSVFLPWMHRGRGAEDPKSKNSAWTISCLAYFLGKRGTPSPFSQSRPGVSGHQSLEGIDNRKDRLHQPQKGMGPSPVHGVGRKPASEVRLQHFGEQRLAPTQARVPRLV